MVGSRAERAPAKVNLTLRVLGRRADNYHEIESLVAFAGAGDTLTFARGKALALDVRGPTAAASGEITDNLVLKAGRALAERIAGLEVGRFVLSKQLPVAAGLGGGSADAAAALRLLTRANRVPLDDPRLIAAARASGADVPACLVGKPCVMRGIGEMLSAPLELPRLPAVLVNPRVAVATKDVFMALRARALSGAPDRAIDETKLPQARADLIEFLRQHGNDLEAPALSLHPAIGDVLAALRAFAGCRLARMSGSGATCFGLFDSARAAEAAARTLRAAHATWWVCATALNGLGAAGLPDSIQRQASEVVR